MKIGVAVFLALFFAQAAFAVERPKFARSVPKTVIAGTNEESLDAYLSSLEKFVFPAKFSTDTGGSLITISIEKKRGKIFVKRVYHEPGVKDRSREYTNLELKNGGSWLSSARIELIKARGGVLVLEYNSGVEGIPKTLWFFCE